MHEDKRPARNAVAKPVRVGLLGCGSIGAPLLELLCKPDVHDRLSLRYIVVRDPERAERQALFTAAWQRWGTRVVSSARFEESSAACLDEVDVVVEAVGPWVSSARPCAAGDDGYVRTRDLLGAALDTGKSVVTANKTVIARWGRELAALADGWAGPQPTNLKFEAAVCGSIPIIRTLSSHWRGQKIRKITGILNGTCNFILTKMVDFDPGLASAYANRSNPPLAWAYDQASQEGLAEPQKHGADASSDRENADLSGRDAAEKLAILASIGFGRHVDCADVSTTSIHDVTVADMHFAAERDYVIKQLAVAELDDHQALSLSVHPTFVPTDHPLANVSGKDNAVCVLGDCGEHLYAGEGAGAATASALLSDLRDIADGTARNREFSTNGAPGPNIRCRQQHRVMGYVRTECKDVNGAFSRKAEILARHGIGVEQMVNLPKFARRENDVELVPDMILINDTTQERVDRALDDLQSETAICESPPMVLRIDRSLEDHHRRVQRSMVSPQETRKR